MQLNEDSKKKRGRPISESPTSPAHKTTKIYPTNILATPTGSFSPSTSPPATTPESDNGPPSHSTTSPSTIINLEPLNMATSNTTALEATLVELNRKQSQQLQDQMEKMLTQHLTQMRLEINGVKQYLEQRTDKLANDIQDLKGSLENKMSTLNIRMDNMEEVKEDFRKYKIESMNTIKTLEEKIDKVKEETTYDRCRSMRGNLVFQGIPELTNETDEQTEHLILNFIEKEMKIPSSNIELSRTHRSGPKKPGKPRVIITNFHKYKQKEEVRKAVYHTLRDTNYSVFEQYPPEITEKRRILVQKMKSIKREQGPRSCRLVIDQLHNGGTTYFVKNGQICSRPNSRFSNSENIPNRVSDFPHLSNSTRHTTPSAYPHTNMNQPYRQPYNQAAPYPRMGQAPIHPHMSQTYNTPSTYPRPSAPEFHHQSDSQQMPQHQTRPPAPEFHHQMETQQTTQHQTNHHRNGGPVQNVPSHQTY